MKIVLTGSLGNISKPLATTLIKQGHTVTVISSKTDKKKLIESLGATAAIGSIEDIPFLIKTFTGADAVYCMLPPFDYFDPNLDIMATTRRQVSNYVEAIKTSGVKKVVHLSSIGAHTDKGNGLLAFHHLAESIFKELPSDVIIKHARPVGFYTNIYDFMPSIKGKGFLGLFLTLRFAGFKNLITGKLGIIAANYGAEDKMPWVSPFDIAAAIAEELTSAFMERKFRYIVSEELTCNQIAGIIGAAIGKPWLKWYVMSDKDMLGGLKMFKMPESRAQGIVDMNAGMHTGLGFNALYGNTTGSHNTAVGAGADVSTTNLSNATSLGSGAVVNASNKVRFANATVTVVEGPVAYTFSDGRFKTNIKEDDVKGLEFINKLRPVVYNLDTKKITEFWTKNMPDTTRKKYLDQDFTASTNIRQSGFIAQEVADAAKSVGYDFNGVHIAADDNDNYSIAYSEMVVPLVKGMQEQQKMIDAQKQLIENLQQQINDLKSQGSATGINQIAMTGSSMDQNTPNPFSNETVIRFNLATAFNTAYMAIYDLSGKQLKTIPITKQGTGSITITTDQLAPGMYIYSIMVDNKLLDSKRMVVAGK